jgi:PadR family transcriptional regulator PadR
MAEKSPLHNWKTQLRKGYLDLCILNHLANEEFYGYDLVQKLKEAEGTTMREGIIYPVLARLQDDGFVTSVKRPSTSGPPRKYYQITDAGRTALSDMNTHWHTMVAAMHASTEIRKEPRHEKNAG